MRATKEAAVFLSIVIGTAFSGWVPLTIFLFFRGLQYFKSGAPPLYDGSWSGFFDLLVVAVVVQSLGVIFGVFIVKCSDYEGSLWLGIQGVVLAGILEVLALLLFRERPELLSDSVGYFLAPFTAFLGMAGYRLGRNGKKPRRVMKYVLFSLAAVLLATFLAIYLPVTKDFAVVSTADSGHSHELVMGGIDVDKPPAGKGLSTNHTYIDLGGGRYDVHNHPIELTRQNYEALKAGRGVIITTSPSGLTLPFHTHTFFIRKP